MFSSPFDHTFAFVTLSAEERTDYALHPNEARILNPRASLKRREEFSLGRAAANLALKQLGLANPPPVLRGAAGEPLWPEGVVGSISHCWPWVVVAAAERSSVSAIGIDLEDASRISPDEVGGFICHPAERAWVGDQQYAQVRMAMIFSAKEAIFKAFYPLCGRFLDFKDVELRWVVERERFAAELLTDLTPELRAGHRFEVGCRRCHDWVLAWLVKDSHAPLTPQVVLRAARSSKSESKVHWNEA